MIIPILFDRLNSQHYHESVDSAIAKRGVVDGTSDVEICFVSCMMKATGTVLLSSQALFIGGGLPMEVVTALFLAHLKSGSCIHEAGLILLGSTRFLVDLRGNPLDKAGGALEAPVSTLRFSCVSS